MPSETNMTEPDPAIFDLSQWPIVQARFPELGLERRVERVLDGFDRLIARGEPFAIIWTLASHEMEEEPHEDEKRSNIWLRRRRLDLAACCRGYVYIVADPVFRTELEKHLVKVARVLPFPKLVVETREAAEAAAGAMMAA